MTIGEFQIRQTVPDDFILIDKDVMQLGLGDLSRFSHCLKSMIDAHTFVDEAGICGMGGFVQLWPGVCEAWSLWTRRAAEVHKKSMLEASREIISSFIETHKVWRMQSLLPPTVPASWLEHLGFTYECELEHYCIDGGNGKMYKIITDKFLRI